MLKQHGEKQADGKWFLLPSERNKDAILDVLSRVLPKRGVVLEIASGTGQHVVHFAKSLPGLTWQPSDPDPELRQSIALRVKEAQLANIQPPIELDVTRLPWPLQTADAVVCINMIHVAPWRATPAMFESSKALLPSGHVLFLYGPYRRFGRYSSKNDEQFDSDLHAQNSDWGVRDLEAVSEVAASSGFVLSEIVDMPANNFSLIFRRT